MRYLNLDQFRTTTAVGGVLSVSIIAQGGMFHIMAETRKGEVVLIKTRGSELRQFRDPIKALHLLQELGIREVKVDTRNWQPEQAAIGKPTRPDSASYMKAAHEAAEIKRVLDSRIKSANDPNTVWHDHDQLFTELDARYAD